MKTYQNVISNFENFSLLGVLRTNNKKLWDNIFENLNYSPVAYSNMNIDFLHEVYKSKKNVEVTDLSSIVYWDNKPVGLWPFFLFKKDNILTFNFLDGKVLPPILNNEINKNIEKKIIKKIIQFMFMISKIIGQKSWESMDLFNNQLGVSLWHSISMELNQKSNIEYDLYINLDNDYETIKSTFRKSYKSLINSGTKKWNIYILDKKNDSVWNQFIHLHFLVSGKKTRSDKSWEIHYQSVINKKSFLIYLLDKNDKMVGAGLFNYTSDEGLYAVAAYDRNLSDQPLGHIVQSFAIKELIKRKVKWYKIGPRPYLNSYNKSTEKEINISEFKNGFANFVVPRLIIIFDLNKLL